MRTLTAPRLAALASALVLAAGAFTLPVARLPFAGLFTMYAYRPAAAVLLVVLALGAAALAMRGPARLALVLATGAAYVVGRAAWQVHRERPPVRTGRMIDAITSGVPGALSAQWGLWVLAIAAGVLLVAGVLLARTASPAPR